MDNNNLADNSCSPPKGTRVKKNRAGIMTWVFEHPRWSLTGALLILLVFPFLLLGLLRTLNILLPAASCVRLKGGIDVWLGFWGSYLGCAATVVLGIGAILLNEKLNQYTAYQNTANEMSIFNNFEVQFVKLYDFQRSYTAATDWFEDRAVDERYLFVVSFQRPFPPQYRITIESVAFWTGFEDDGFFCQAPVEGTSGKCRIISNCDGTTLYLLRKDEASLQKFYSMHLTDKTAPRDERLCSLDIQMRCDNTLYQSYLRNHSSHSRNQYYHPLRVRLRMYLDNMGIFDDPDHPDDCPMKLSIENRIMTSEAVEAYMI